MTDKIYYPEVIDGNPLPGTNEEIVEGQIVSKIQSDQKSLQQPINNGFPSNFIASEVISASLNSQSRKILGNFTFGAIGALQIGEYVSGSSGDVKISTTGIVARNSAGATTFSIDGTTGSATFLGTVAAGSIVTGYIAVGGAASDVNSGATTINGGKLTTGTVTADYVVASISISSPTITGGTIAIGTGDSIFKADSNGIYLGNATFASAPFRVTMAGAVTASNITLTNASVGSGSSWSGNQIANAYIGELSASKITSDTMSANRISGGTLTLGGNNNQYGNFKLKDGSGNDAIVLDKDGMTLYGTGGDDLYWISGATGMGSLGYLSASNTMYFISLGAKDMTILSDNDLYLAADANVYITGTLHVGGNELHVNNQSITFYKTGDHNGVQFASGADFSVDTSGSWFHVNGNDKSAIVLTKDGYKALYCAEAPEVWFFDFCGPDKEIDPLFLEVTEGEMKFIKCADGGYQVWRRRKGHAEKRFAPKTQQEFEKNERFLAMAKL